MKAFLVFLILGSSLSAMAGYECTVTSGLKTKKLKPKEHQDINVPLFQNHNMLQGAQQYFTLAGDFNCISETQCTFEGTVLNHRFSNGADFGRMSVGEFKINGNETQRLDIEGRAVQVACKYNRAPFEIGMSSKALEVGDVVLYSPEHFQILVEVTEITGAGKVRVRDADTNSNNNFGILKTRDLSREVECVGNICIGTEGTLNKKHFPSNRLKVLKVYENGVVKVVATNLQWKPESFEKVQDIIVD
jgi:hypothetical protein